MSETTRTAWAPLPPARTILQWPLPLQEAPNRWLLRGLSILARQQVLSITGLEHVRAARDPFILALNHSTRNEAILVPALLFLYRNGHIIHFMADWNYRLLPLIGMIYRRAETITVTRKSARPRMLNVLKPLYVDPLSALGRAYTRLAAGRSVGIFPEGAVNRDPERLLPGRRGAAHLSMITGAPIVPAGIRFPGSAHGAPIGDRAAMQVHIGMPMQPPAIATNSLTRADVQAWHAEVMREIGRLSGKTWETSDARQ